MGMLSSYDIAWMEDTVQDIIEEWRTKIFIFSKLDVSKQANYNKYMNEFTGPIEASMITIMAERKDITNNQTNDPIPDDVEYGKKNQGTILFAIPNTITVDGEEIVYKPSIHDIIKIDDSEDTYYVRNIRDRIGETLLTIRRFVGNSPVIENVDDKIFIRDYDWGDSNE